MCNLPEDKKLYILLPSLYIGIIHYPEQLTYFKVEAIPDLDKFFFGEFKLKISWRKPEGACVYGGSEKSKNGFSLNVCIL